MDQVQEETRRNLNNGHYSLIPQMKNEEKILTKKFRFVTADVVPDNFWI